MRLAGRCTPISILSKTSTCTTIITTTTSGPNPQSPLINPRNAKPPISKSGKNSSRTLTRTLCSHQADSTHPQGCRPIQSSRSLALPSAPPSTAAVSAHPRLIPTPLISEVFHLSAPRLNKPRLAGATNSRDGQALPSKAWSWQPPRTRNSSSSSSARPCSTNRPPFKICHWKSSSTI